MAVPESTRAPAAALGRGDVEDMVRENTHLRAKLASLPVIEQAKGVLMGRYELNADAAFSLLCRWSSHANTKLHVLSGLLVAAAAQPRTVPPVELEATSAGAPLDEFLAQLKSGRLPDPEGLADQPSATVTW